MRMSNETQTVVKILTGIIGSVALLVTGVAVNNYAETQKEQTSDIKKILIFMNLYEYRMSQVESKIGTLETNDREFQRTFSTSIEKIGNAREQLQEFQDSDKKNSNNEQVANHQEVEKDR